MGLFNNFFETKYCNVCGEQISVLKSKKIIGGYCCNKCAAKLSPFFTKMKQSTAEDIKFQLECRKKNTEKLSQMHTTRTIGNHTKLFIDENAGLFVIDSSNNYRNNNSDVFSFGDVMDCSIDIEESRKEIKYIDSNDNVKSFNPACYAYSYDFYIEISVNIPYIDAIRFKINDKPVNNGQSTTIKYEGGLVNKFADAFITNRSYNGMTSNANEVRESEYYKKCNSIANEIKEVLLAERYKSISSVNKIVTCPWCGSRVYYTDKMVCDRCGGGLDI